MYKENIEKEKQKIAEEAARADAEKKKHEEQQSNTIRPMNQFELREFFSDKKLPTMNNEAESDNNPLTDVMPNFSVDAIKELLEEEL